MFFNKTKMKKSYIIPKMQLTVIACEQLIAESIGINGDSSKKTTVANGGWAKENTSTPDYNVWDDDWSKN